MAAPLSQEEFTKFFHDRRNGTYKCPFCSKEHFILNIVGSGSTDMALLRVVSENNAFHEFFSFSCGTCGHTDFFHVNQVEQWRAQKAKENSEGAKNGG